MSRHTSSGPSATGNTLGTRIGCILTISSGRSSVTEKRNFRPVIAWSNDTADVPWSTR
ncbi:hypothetical protein ACLKMY_30330 [Paraburkholderia mimosarum]|uniref:hypothetical protein n=1 Tax=Paraburkholderia mimosarum TaxID=312026 RepID=UPI00192E6461